MNQTLEIQELAIVITAKNYDPSLLNPGFLKYSAIIPEEWKIAKKPIVSNRSSQIVFNNGVYIASQPNRLIFVEAINNKKNNVVEVPALVNRYVEILRNMEYKSVGINYRGYVTCTDATVDSNRYLFDNLIQPGEWQNCSANSVKAEVSFKFNYDDKQLNLNINEAILKLPESEPKPIVLFDSNFNYNLTSDSSDKTLPMLKKIIGNWHQDLDIYKDVVSKFIKIQPSNEVELQVNREPVAV